GLRERLEPVGDLIEPLVARGLRHARVHVRVLVRLTGDRRLQVRARRADRQARGRIADRLEVLEVPVRMAGLALGRRAEYGRDVVVALDVRLRREIEVPAVRLGLARERVLQVLLCLRALELHLGNLLSVNDLRRETDSPAGVVFPSPGRFRLSLRRDKVVLRPRTVNNLRSSGDKGVARFVSAIIGAYHDFSRSRLTLDAGV